MLRACRRCSSELPLGALVCEHCRSLVYASELDQISNEARQLEQANRFMEARERWHSALKFLPPSSKQAVWIEAHNKELEESARAIQNKPPDHQWAKKLGPLGPIAIILAKGKSLLAIFKLKFLFSFLSFIVIYWGIYGAWFGVGFALLILFHELGHYVDIKRRGLPAEMPVFLPGIGAYVKWQALGVSLETRAAVSLAGPLAGLVAAIFCMYMWTHTGNHLWGALAQTSAWLNLLNLIPIWVLDGSQAILAITKVERVVLLMAAMLVGAYFHEGIFLFIVGGLVYRLFTKDLPSQASYRTTAYFLVVMTALAIVLHLVPDLRP